MKYIRTNNLIDFYGSQQEINLLIDICYLLPNCTCYDIDNGDECWAMLQIADYNKYGKEILDIIFKIFSLHDIVIDDKYSEEN